MSDPKLDLAREVFKLLSATSEGYDRKALAAALGVEDREMREAVERCAKLCSEPSKPGALPWVVGFDPMTERYHAANSPEQAARIISYSFSYVRAGLEKARAYVKAYRVRWPQAEVPQAVQQGLFDADEIERDVRRYSR
ncbi:MAG: hypothetical protein SFU83_23560 [Meiothermus sp.]|nr:hypothetical protein [Meiothermus sp.]